MTPIDPNEAAKAGNTLAEHGEVLMRIGLIAFFSGVVGGTWRFIRDSHRRRIPFGPKLLLYYLSKIGVGFPAAYLALLVLPIFGIGTSTESEQAIGIIAAIVGADFIGIIMRRVLGTVPSDSWDGTERRNSNRSEYQVNE